MEQEIEKWQRELTEAGWTEIRLHIWKAPNGELFRGPYYAWQMMESCKQHGGEPIGNIIMRKLGRQEDE